jgi:hypothetical protein
MMQIVSAFVEEKAPTIRSIVDAWELALKID